MNCLYILEIKPWFIASFANVFSHSVGFFLFMVSFAVQKLVSVIRSHLFIFVFISIWETNLKNIGMIFVTMFCPCSLLGVLWFYHCFKGEVITKALRC